MHGLEISCSDVQYGFPFYSTLERPKDTLATLDYGPWTLKMISLPCPTQMSYV